MQRPLIWSKIEQRKHLLLTIAVIVVFFTSKLPYLHLPFFWDEAWVYGPAVRLMANTRLSERLLLIKQFQFGEARTELYRKKPVYLEN